MLNDGLGAVEFADLRGTLLGLTVGNRVLIDADAAGFGYFVDATPLDDLEFLVATGQANSEEARGRVMASLDPAKSGSTSSRLRTVTASSTRQFWRS